MYIAIEFRKSINTLKIPFEWCNPKLEGRIEGFTALFTAAKNDRTERCN